MARKPSTVPAGDPTADPSEALSRFGAATRAWFSAAFAAPTRAQAEAWRAVSAGRHALVVAPTGSGKTLAAFLWALDRLAAAGPPEQRQRRCRVLYVSPLKALAVDVERNLRAPLAGIRHAAARLGLPQPDITVGMRTGDTPADERRAFSRTPPDILITTPESLYLLLTSAAREALRGVETVIVDEVHAVCPTKRGAHLALSLERLDALLERPAQRIGLSATVRPIDETARFLGGAAPVQIVQPPSAKTVEVSVEVPVEDMTRLDEVPDDDTGAGPRRSSIWPAVEQRVYDLISTHRSTIVFTNSRRGAERLCARLNEIAAQRHEGRTPEFTNDGHQPAESAGPARPPLTLRQPPAESAGPARPPLTLRQPPAEIMAQSGAAAGAPPVIARAHHGSVSREERVHIEEALKSGQLPAVVATSSLELGIDMGAVDLVVQIAAPPSVAAGLQRVGRAGHQVGAVSRGVLFPQHRGDLLAGAVVAERMRDGAIEELRYPRNPLDVLAQQIVAMVAMEPWQLPELAAVLRRAAPFAELPESALHGVLDMLCGRYPSTAFAELRPRLIWDRSTDLLTARPGAQRLAVTSGGTIPDRGLFGVFLAGSAGPAQPARSAQPAPAGAGRARSARVGELDEEMVYESRVGDVFLLGSTSWRIEEITADRVLVTPAPGAAARMPFWKGESPGRPVELGRAIGARLRELSRLGDDAGRVRLAGAGLDGWAADNLLGYLREQREATRQLPDDRTIVVERFRDELGDWRLTVHCVLGARVNAPWALAIGRRLAERYGVDGQVVPSDDGIVVRLPDVADEAPGADLVAFDPDEISSIVESAVAGSAMFAARFRECAARALLLPRRDPARRQPLWQQRQRAGQLLDVAREYTDFPITLEAARECLRDVFDVPGLTGLMRDLAGRAVRLVEVETPRPSPFARSLLFGYVGAFLYEGDAPLAERRAAALALDSTLLAELLGRVELRELLDPAVVSETERRLQWLEPVAPDDARPDDSRPADAGPEDAGPEDAGPEDSRPEDARPSGGRRARDAEDVAEMLRTLGDLSTVEALARGAAEEWLTALEAARRAIRVRIAGQERWLAIEDAGRVRDALGVALPVGLPAAYTEPMADPLGDLLARYARTHAPFSAQTCAARFSLGVFVVEQTLQRLCATGRLVSGEFTPGGTGTEWCDSEVLRLLRRRSLAALRREIEPVPHRALARFLPRWQHVGRLGRRGAGLDGASPDGSGRGDDGPSRGVEAVAAAIEQLQGVAVPASALERLILPARVGDYSPAYLDELCASGEVLWAGAGSIAGGDGWLCLAYADTAPLLLPPPEPDAVATPLHAALLDALGDGQALFFRSLCERLQPASDTDLLAAVWDLVWGGWIGNDTLAPLRAVLAGTGAHRSRPSAPRSRYQRPGRPSLRSVAVARSSPPTAAGRWYRLPERDLDPTRRGAALAEALLERHGVLTRAAVAAEGVPGGFAAVYRVLTALEERGAARRGYFVEGLGAAQFAVPGAVDRLRAMAEAPGAAGVTAAQGAATRGGATTRGPALVLAATDPANPYGAALPWPERVIDSADRDPAAANHPTIAGGSQATGTSATGTPASTSATGTPASTSATGTPASSSSATGHRAGRKAGALVVGVDGELVLYVERGGRTLLSFVDDADALAAAAKALADAVHSGALGALSVERADGETIHTSALRDALAGAGFRVTPRGLRLRG